MGGGARFPSNSCVLTPFPYPVYLPRHLMGRATCGWRCWHVHVQPLGQDPSASSAIAAIWATVSRSRNTDEVSRRYPASRAPRYESQLKLPMAA